MKSLAVFVFLTLLIVSYSCKSGSGAGNSMNDSVVMVIPNPVFNFGEVKEGTKIFHEFRIENHGSQDLLIFEVNRSCGCTVVEFDKEPIKPGKSGIVKLRFNTEGRSGKVHKKATIISNSPKGDPDLILEGSVIPDPAKK